MQIFSNLVSSKWLKTFERFPYNKDVKYVCFILFKDNSADNGLKSILLHLNREAVRYVSLLLKSIQSILLTAK